MLKKASVLLVLIVLAYGSWAALPFISASDSRVKIPASESSIENGRNKFGQHCASCHGMEGEADGPMSQFMNPKLNKFSDSVVQEKEDEALFLIISEGVGGMPSYKYLSEEDRWDIVAYMRSLKK